MRVGLTGSSGDQHDLHLGRACIMTRNAPQYRRTWMLSLFGTSLANWFGDCCSDGLKVGCLGGSVSDAKIPARSGGKGKLCAVAAE